MEENIYMLHRHVCNEDVRNLTFITFIQLHFHNHPDLTDKIVARAIN